MDENFLKVKNYLIDLEYSIVEEFEEDGVFIIENEDAGIKNMVIACEDPILILEQYLFDVNGNTRELFESLLKKNRDIIHGAFALDEEGKKVIFRDTLQLENLDSNELEGSINSLSVLLSEYATDIVEYSA